MTRRCPICGLDTFNKKVIQTGYLNISAIKECSNCTWKQVIRLSGPGGPAIGKIVAEQREALRQVLQRTGSIQATAAELKGRQVERRRSFSAAEQAATRLTSDTSRPRSPRLPKPKPPRPSRSRLLLERARSTAPAVTPQSGCGLCGNTHPRHKTGSNRCQAVANWRKIDAGEWLKRSEQQGFDKLIAIAWPQQHQHNAITSVYARAKAGRSIVLAPAGTDTTATLTKARVRLWCSLNPGSAPTQAFTDLYSSS